MIYGLSTWCGSECYVGVNSKVHQCVAHELAHVDLLVCIKSSLVYLHMQIKPLDTQEPKTH